VATLAGTWPRYIRKLQLAMIQFAISIAIAKKKTIRSRDHPHSRQQPEARASLALNSQSFLGPKLLNSFTQSRDLTGLATII
jgi:hypothetical protein